MSDKLTCVTVTPNKPMSKDTAMLLECLINRELRTQGSLLRQVKRVIAQEVETIVEQAIKWQMMPEPTFTRDFSAKPLSAKLHQKLCQAVQDAFG